MVRTTSVRLWFLLCLTLILRWYHQWSSPDKIYWRIEFINVRHSVLVPLYCLEFLGPHPQAHNKIFWTEFLHIQENKSSNSREVHHCLIFFLHAKLEVLRSFFPPFGEAMPSTKPDKNRVRHPPQHAVGFLWGEAWRWLPLQKVQGDRQKRRIYTSNNWEATAGREGAWGSGLKKKAGLVWPFFWRCLQWLSVSWTLAKGVSTKMLFNWHVCLALSCFPYVFPYEPTIFPCWPDPVRCQHSFRNVLVAKFCFRSTHGKRSDGYLARKMESICLNSLELL